LTQIHIAKQRFHISHFLAQMIARAGCSFFGQFAYLLDDVWTAFFVGRVPPFFDAEVVPEFCQSAADAGGVDVSIQSG
jgi:hypothetical protein